LCLRWVYDWILRSDTNQIIPIYSINYNVSQSKILMSLVTHVMWWGWLIDRPVVKWWVPHWILRVELYVHIILWLRLSKLNSNWCWFISNQILESTSSYVRVEDDSKIVSIRFLC
jgi:hypothetical protein